LGIAEAGRGTTCETLADEAVAPGFGKSKGRISRTRPGLSARQSPNAADPVSGADWAEAEIEASVTIAPANGAATSNAGIDRRTRLNRRALEISEAVAAGRFMFATFSRISKLEGTGWIRHRREGSGALTVMCTVNQFAG